MDNNNDDEEVSDWAKVHRDRRQRDSLPLEHTEYWQLRRVPENRRRYAPGKREIAQVNHMASAFTIKDVERNIPTFTDDDKMTIYKSIKKFEDTSLLLQ